MILKGRNDIGVLVEAYTSIGHDAGDARPRLSVINAVTSPHNRLRSKLVGKANARLNVAPVGYIVRALLVLAKTSPPVQGHSTGLPVTASVKIGYRHSRDWSRSHRTSSAGCGDRCEAA